MTRQRGFTLVELLLAISILALVISVTYSALNGIIETKVILEDQREARQIANATLVRLTRELQLAYEGIPRLPPRNEPKKRFHSSDNVLGEVDNMGGTKFSKITFIALSGGQYIPDGGTHAGIVQITYSVRENPEADLGDLENRTYLLVREERPYIRPPEKAYEKEMIFPVTEDLVGFNLRYYDSDQQSWHDTWGEESRDGVPALIQFSLQIRSPRGRIERFSSMVALQAGVNS